VTHVSALQCVPRSHPALAGHFPRAPIVPGAWLLTLVESFCRAELGADVTVSSIEYVRFRQPLLPDQHFRIRVTELPDDVVDFSVERDGSPVAEGRIIVRSAR
jgi:3-hydroxymyristoyl/3-hydroxydecanoyl-(acyl carrier protein) dehydratase